MNQSDGLKALMMTERRYREDEVRKIFKLATTDKVASAPASRTPSGLTLAEMQSIGQEVGIEPDMVARAAAALDTTAPTSTRKSLGMPVEVGSLVPLPRALTDHEWEMLVSELRRIFRARGHVSAMGSIREWRNGNLHVVVEPAQTGYRLRLGTFKGDAAGINALGGFAIAASLATFLAHYLINDPTALIPPTLMGAGGVAALVTNWLRLPAWARKRETHFQEIAAKVRSIVEQP
jgi:hypothetical protein